MCVCKAYDLNAKINSVYKLVNNLPQLKTVQGVPMERERVESNCDEIDQYYVQLEKILNDKIPSAFIMNIDEAGFSDWADAIGITIVAPSDFNEEKVQIPIDRCSKRASMLAGICADGSVIPPCIIIQRKTIEKELLDAGYTPEKLCIAFQENGFFDHSVFQKWAEEYFFPFIEKRRENFDYAGESLLILDGFSVHDCDEFLDECTYHGVYPLFLPPHSSDQTQPLDLGIFAVQKSKMSRMTVPQEFSNQSQQIMKIVDSFTQAATISNIRGAFKAAGIISKFDANENKMFSTVDRAFASRVRHWAYHPYEITNKKRISLK